MDRIEDHQKEGGGSTSTAPSQYIINVNGRSVHVHDATPTGRQVRQAAGANPASEYVLIVASDGSARSLGLDEVVDLRELEKPVFRLFKSDRIFTLTIDERGFEWGDENLSETELRAFAEIPLDLEIVLINHDGEKAIPEGANIFLGGHGSERLYTRERTHLITIYVNGRPRKVPGPLVTFSEIVSMAPNMPPPSETVQFTVQYTRGPAESPAGTLVEGQSVKVQEGMEFDVTPTNRS